MHVLRRGLGGCGGTAHLEPRMRKHRYLDACCPVTEPRPSEPWHRVWPLRLRASTAPPRPPAIPSSRVAPPLATDDQLQTACS